MSFHVEGPFASGTWLAWDVRIDPEWRAFAGHFPGRPILPAIGHLFLVQRILETRHGAGVSIVAIDRLRLMRPIVPGARVRVRLDLRAPGETSRFAIEEADVPISEASFRWSSASVHGRA